MTDQSGHLLKNNLAFEVHFLEPVGLHTDCEYKSHYDKMPVQYTAILMAVKMVIFR